MGAAGALSQATAGTTPAAATTDTDASPLNGQWVDADIRPPKADGMQLT